MGAEIFCLVHKDRKGQTVAGVTTKPHQMLLGQVSSGPVLSLKRAKLAVTLREGTHHIQGHFFLSWGHRGLALFFLHLISACLHNTSS